MKEAIRVLIADDHAVVRDGIRRILEDQTDTEVVGEARDGKEAVERVLELHPDVVVMDINMPEMNGLDATRKITEKAPSVRVLGLTVHENPLYFFHMLDAGAAGYLLKKDATSTELTTAIRSVHKEGVYLHPTVNKWLIQDRLGRGPLGSGEGLIEELTGREEQVLTMLAEGHSNQEIGELLHLSPATIQTHRSNIMRKLNLHSRVDLVKYALRHGIIQLEE